MPKESGQCGFCGRDRIYIKNGVWMCPYMYGSGLHFCDPYVYQTYEIGIAWIRENIFKDSGVTLEDYLEARKKWENQLEPLLT